MLKAVNEFDSPWWYEKGHINPEEMRIQVAVYGDDPPPRENIKIFYAWLRINPAPCGDYDFTVGDGTPGRRGTFPATVAWCAEHPGVKEWPRKP